MRTTLRFVIIISLHQIIGTSVSYHSYRNWSRWNSPLASASASHRTTNTTSSYHRAPGPSHCQAGAPPESQEPKYVQVALQGTTGKSTIAAIQTTIKISQVSRFILNLVFPAFVLLIQFSTTTTVLILSFPFRFTGPFQPPRFGKLDAVDANFCDPRRRV